MIRPPWTLFVPHLGCDTSAKLLLVAAVPFVAEHFLLRAITALGTLSPLLRRGGFSVLDRGGASSLDFFHEALECEGAVRALRAGVTGNRYDAARKMGNLHSRLSFVDMLALLMPPGNQMWAAGILVRTFLNSHWIRGQEALKGKSGVSDPLGPK